MNIAHENTAYFHSCTADPWATWRRSAKERRTFSKHFLAFDAKTLLLGVCVWYVMRALCIVVAEDLYASGL